VTFEHYDLPETTRDGDIHEMGDGMRGVWFKDPSGNIISLVASRPAQRPAPAAIIAADLSPSWRSSGRSSADGLRRLRRRWNGGTVVDLDDQGGVDIE
jgi:hypothetical protein